MKRVLITIPWFLPAFRAGGPVQSIANMLKETQGMDIEYMIVTSNKDLGGIELEGVVADKWINYAPGVKIWYSSGKRYRNFFASLVKEQKPDLVFINGLYSWPFTLVPLLTRSIGKKILSVRGMLHPGALAQKSFKKRAYLFLLRLAGLHKRCVFHATDDAEAGFIKNIFGQHVPVKVAANFPRQIAFAGYPHKEKGALNLLTVALISPMKNHLEVIKSLEHISSTVRISYQIFGPVKDEAYWKECLSAISLLPPNIKVSYGGEINPEEIATQLSVCHVFIQPSESENFGHALYEALSAGRPVITSCATPWNGLAAAFAGINIDMRAYKNDLANAIMNFADMDATEYHRWNEGAGTYAQNAVDINTTKVQYAALFELNNHGA